jgi:hypothetical protein
MGLQAKVTVPSDITTPLAYPGPYPEGTKASTDSSAAVLAGNMSLATPLPLVLLLAPMRPARSIRPTSSTPGKAAPVVASVTLTSMTTLGPADTPRTGASLKR